MRSKLLLQVAGSLLLFNMAVTHLFSKNQLAFKSQLPVCAFIQGGNLSDKKILVFNEQLPSIAFHLQRDVISLNYDDKYLKRREVELDRDQDWPNFLINLDETDAASLQSKFTGKNSVLIENQRDSIPQKLKWLVDDYQHVQHIGHWKVYY